MKKAYSLVLIIFVLPLLAHAQSPNYGRILLSSGEEVAGIVDINSFTNSALITMEDGRQLTYHASMIKEISTTDDCEHINTFRTYDYRSNGFFDRLEKKVFQVMADGDITLLRRTFEYDVFDANDEYEIEEWYYESNGEIRRIKNFKRQILPLMSDQKSEMKAFRERNNIKNLNKEVNMYLMVSYYNRLSTLSVASVK